MTIIDTIKKKFIGRNHTLINFPSELSNALPVDLLIEIFSFLCVQDLVSNVSRVNRQWNQIIHHNEGSSDDILWKNIFECSCYLSMYLNSSSIVAVDALFGGKSYREIVTQFCRNGYWLMDHPSSSSNKLLLQQVPSYKEQPVLPMVIQVNKKYMSQDPKTAFVVSRHGMKQCGSYLFRTRIQTIATGCCVGIVSSSQFEQPLDMLQTKLVGYYRDGSITCGYGSNTVNRITAGGKDEKRWRVYYHLQEDVIFSMVLHIGENASRLQFYINGQPRTCVDNIQIESPDHSFHFFIRMAHDSQFKVLETVNMNGSLNLRSDRDVASLTEEGIARQTITDPMIEHRYPAL